MAKKDSSTSKPKPATKASAKPSKRASASDSLLASADPKANAKPAPSITHPLPIPLGQVLGQERAVATLTNALSSGRIHHAWIFHGAEGVGKFTTALAFAALLLDPTTARGLSGEWQADDESSVARLIRSGTHPDLHVITKELARFSEDAQVRDRKLITIPKDVVETHLLEPAALAASVRNDARAAKVFIVDEAELLDRSPTNAPVQNALLKTIEEPADRTVIILVTSSEDRLLTTIRSRCQRVSFTPLDDAAMKRWLKAQNLDLPPEEIGWLLELSAGSPGLFNLAREGGLFAWHVELSPLLARTMRGEFVPQMGAKMHELVKGWAEGWVKRHENASKEAANKAGVDWILRLVAEQLRKVVRSGAHAATPVAPGVEAALAGFDLIREAERRIDANVDMGFVFEALAADLAAAFAGELVL